MNKFLSILNGIMAGEMAVMQAVPVLTHGPAGNVLTISLIAESQIAAFLQALQAAKTSSPAPAVPATPAA